MIALGQERECLGIDRDPVAAHLAAANAAVCGLASVNVECRDAAADALAGCTAWHIDPDRRPDGKRTVRAERFEPSWETVEGLLGRCPNGIVKVAPATELSDELTPSVEVVAALPPSEKLTLRPGATAVARVHCGRRSLGYVWLHELWEAIRLRLFV